MINTDDVMPVALDPDRVTIAQLAANGQPISLPWFPKAIAVGTMFHSERCNTSNPFGHTSPFDSFSLHSTSLAYGIDDGAECTFRSAETKTKLTSHDHLGCSLGVTVGNSFLSANVTGRYDKDVKENTNGYKKSIKTRCQYGSILFATVPRLSDSALATLKHGGGIRAFKERYGDYYVSGYRLGGETGMMLGMAENQKETLEQYSITATAKVLFVEASITYSKFFKEASASSSITVLGYDTLGNKNVNLSGFAALQTDAEKLQSAATALENLGQDLGLRIQEIMLEFGLVPGDLADRGLCERICQSGLVMELYLTSVDTLREVMLWGMNDNII